MNDIRFSYVWDKLRDSEFTTIRSWNAEKEKYYQDLIGKVFRIWKAKETYPFYREYILCKAFLKSAMTVKTNTIPERMLKKDVMLNGSIDHKWYDRIMKQDQVIVLEFTKAPVEQTTLGMELRYNDNSV